MSDQRRWLDELNQDPKVKALDPRTHAQLERLLSAQPRFQALDGEAASRVRSALPKTPAGTSAGRPGSISKPSVSKRLVSNPFGRSPALSAAPTLSLVGAAGLGALFMVAVQTGRTLFEPSAWMAAEPNSGQVGSNGGTVSPATATPIQTHATQSLKTHWLRFGSAPPLEDQQGCDVVAGCSFPADTGPYLSNAAAFTCEKEPERAWGVVWSPPVDSALGNRPPTPTLPVAEASAGTHSARSDVPTAAAPEEAGDGVRAPRRVARAAFSVNDGSDRLREETLLLEAARADLARNPQRALASAQQHQARFAKGQLVAQRVLIQIEAYLRLGQDARAVALSRSLSNSLFQQRADNILHRYGAVE